MCDPKLTGSCQISIFDSGPKVISLGTASSNAYRKWDVRVSRTVMA